MTTYTYREDGYDEDFHAADDQAAVARATEMLLGGEYGEITKTTRIRASVWAGGTDDEGEKFDILVENLMEELEPEAPKCAGPEHDWRDGGPNGELPVVSHGGGVVITEHCGYCLTTRLTDTWDTDPADGTTMTTLEYQEPTDEDKARMVTVTFWVTDTTQPRALAVEPEAAGVHVPADVLDWAEGLGLSEGNTDVYLLVSTLDRDPVDMSGWFEYIEFGVTAADAARAAAATANLEAERAGRNAVL
jgi:hypothetical protein